MAKEPLDREAEEEKHIRTILEQDIEFTGTLKFTTSLKIKGGFNGEINAKGHLHIGKKAIVKANIKAKQVTIYGKVEGNIKATEKVELLMDAELTGDIHTPDLIIQSGCQFNGKCFMIPKEEIDVKQEQQAGSIPESGKNKK